MRTSVFLSALLLAGSVFALAADEKEKKPATIASVLNGNLSNEEEEFVPAADALGEDKYSFAPTAGEFKGARTFAEQIKHVAAVNYILGAAILGEKLPTGDEKGPAAMTSKAEIMKYLRDSFAYLHKALATIDAKSAVGTVPGPFGDGPAPRLRLAAISLSHVMDHYGQLAVYLRMNGVIPPASRQ